MERDSYRPLDLTAPNALQQLVQALCTDGIIQPSSIPESLTSSGSRFPPSPPLKAIADLKLPCVTAVNGSQLLNQNAINHWFANRHQLRLVAIDPLGIDASKITRLMSLEFARKYQILVLEEGEDRLVVGCANPANKQWLPLLQQSSGRSIEVVVVDAVSLSHYQGIFYQLRQSIVGAQQQAVSDDKRLPDFEQLLEIQENDNNEQHIVKIVEWILTYAFEQNASDIHVEPKRDKGVIRLRIDGFLHQIYAMPSSVVLAVVSRFKVLGRMDISEKRRSQDGRIKTKSNSGLEVELRLSTLMTVFGEKLVVRIFEPDTVHQSFASMGLSDSQQQQWSQLMRRPHGIIMVSGPTGSGKTTTLYSSLLQMEADTLNICTVEDPIEMVMPGLNQTQVQPQIHINFPQAIRALLRQDPDVIMVGEIRDSETAEMAVRAALTGHLVITTVHAQDSISTLVRLLNLGIPLHLLKTTLIAVMAQRLVRRLCHFCKQPADKDDHWQQLVAWQASLRGSTDEVLSTASSYLAKGCQHCRYSGYRGRLGIYELMQLDSNLTTCMEDSFNAEILRRQLYTQGWLSLLDNAIGKVQTGDTSSTEILRVISGITNRVSL